MKDISIVINAHTEGALARPSIKSALKAELHAQNAGLSVEIIAILDASDADTRSEFFEYRGKMEIVSANFLDLASSRNFGVDQCNSKYIAFMDADDIWKSDWLTLAFNYLEAHNTPAIAHPEMNIFFGDQIDVVLHKSSDLIQKNLLAFRNAWTSASFAPRDILSDIRYPSKNHAQQIGFEDWGWNLRTIAAGYKHVVVPNTAHMIRKKRTSLSKSESAINCFPERCDIFK